MKRILTILPAAALTLGVSCSSVLAAAAEGGGSPQLLQGVPEGLITALTSLAIFIVLLVVLGRFAWGPIVEGLKAREERIRKDLADAQAAARKAEATLQEYNARLATADAQVRELIAKANTEGEQLSMRIKMQAQQDAEEIKERATRDIDAARKQAVADIYREAADLATSIAGKILRRNLNPDDQRDLVERSLDQLQTVGKQ